MLRTLAAALVLAGWPALAANGVRVLERRPIPVPEAPAATHRLTLHVFRFAGSRWRAEQIAAALPAAAQLLAQCGVSAGRVEAATLQAPRKFHLYYTPVSRELVRELTVPKPAVFFVDDTRNRPAFDAEAIGLANAATRPELANTVWVAYGTRDLAHALAHELVHVLSDSGEHSSEPANLMNEETSPDNVHLSAAQCERLRTRGEANGLLVKLSREVMK